MKYKTMGLFAGALKRVKNSLGHIAKNAGNFITLAGKSKILGMLAPTGLGSFVNKSLEKLGKSVYDTGSYMRGEINGDQYLDSLAETNKYGAVFGPYNFYKTIKEHGFKDGSKIVLQDNIDYFKEFLPFEGNPQKTIDKVVGTATNIGKDVYDYAKTDFVNTYNEIKEEGIDGYLQNRVNETINQTTNRVNNTINQTTNVVNQKIDDVNSFINDGPIDYYRQKATEKAKQIASGYNQGKSVTNDVMSKIYNYIDNVNK